MIGFLKKLPAVPICFRSGNFFSLISMMIFATCIAVMSAGSIHKVPIIFWISLYWIFGT